LKQFQELAGNSDLTVFAKDYLNIFNAGFQWAFGVAVIAMIISLVIYLVNKKYFPGIDNKDTTVSNADNAEIKMEVHEIRQRLYALLAVFGVVIFFWFSFHQNGLTLTKFAKDYTNLSPIHLNLGITEIKGAEIFQSINPFFVVILTPVIMWIFGFLRNRGKEPSTPKKIAIGMFIAALGFVVMAVGSYLSKIPLYSSIDPHTGGVPLLDAQRVTPLLLFATYFILTVAELFISPLGISFVSKVAPAKYKGVMQGGWLGATAIGNQLLFIGAVLYEKIPIWATWTVFVVACLISMTTMLLMLKWLERITK